MTLAILKQLAVVRRKSLLALAMLISASLALQLFVVLVQEPQLEKQRSEWQRQRELEGRGVSLQSRELLYKNGLADIARFRERLYLKSQFARFIGELYDLAARDGLEISAITYKPTLNKEEQLLEYQLNMTVSGRYPQVKRFIVDLGNATNILVTDSISLASTGASADTVQLQMLITSYFRMEEK